MYLMEFKNKNKKKWPTIFKKLYNEFSSVFILLFDIDRNDSRKMCDWQQNQSVPNSLKVFEILVDIL